MTSHKRICCNSPYAHKCQKFFSENETSSKIQEVCGRNDNFILISTKYILDLYQCTRKNILADDFLKSVVTSVTLFAIGIQLTREFYISKLPLIFHSNYYFNDMTNT